MWNYGIKYIIFFTNFKITKIIFKIRFTFDMQKLDFWTINIFNIDVGMLAIRRYLFECLWMIMMMIFYAEWKYLQFFSSELSIQSCSLSHLTEAGTHLPSLQTKCFSRRHLLSGTNEEYHAKKKKEKHSKFYAFNKQTRYKGSHEK